MMWQKLLPASAVIGRVCVAPVPCWYFSVFRGSSVCTMLVLLSVPWIFSVYHVGTSRGSVDLQCVPCWYFSVFCGSSVCTMLVLLGVSWIFSVYHVGTSRCSVDLQCVPCWYYSVFCGSSVCTMLVLLGVPWIFSAFGVINAAGSTDLEMLQGIFNVGDLSRICLLTRELKTVYGHMMPPLLHLSDICCKCFW